MGKVSNTNKSLTFMSVPSNIFLLSECFTSILYTVCGMELKFLLWRAILSVSFKGLQHGTQLVVSFSRWTQYLNLLILMYLVKNLHPMHNLVTQSLSMFDPGNVFFFKYLDNLSYLVLCST